MISFLFIDTERVWRGGQDQLLTLLRGFCDRRHQVHLVCHPKTLLEERARSAGAVVHPLSIPREIGVSSLVRLRRIISRLRPEILAFNTPRSILPGNLASRHSSVRVRIIFRRVNFPLGENFITRLKYTWGIDCIVAISDSIKQQLQAGGVPSSLIRTIHEGLDLSLYPERETAWTARGPDPIVVGTLASLSPEKGLTYLVKAASLIPYASFRLRFVIVGDGECRGDLERQVRQEGLESIFQFVGFQDQVLTYLNAFHLLVLPSLSEGLSSAILAAMAASLPVIATNVGGIPELVQHGHNGLLVPPRDPIALAEAIQILCDNPRQAREMGKRGRQRMEERFTLERKISETEELCYSLLQMPAPSPGAAHA
jgi:glycosyltransferase involved in cell wall biosynthesis